MRSDGVGGELGEVAGGVEFHVAEPVGPGGIDSREERERQVGEELLGAAGGALEYFAGLRGAAGQAGDGGGGAEAEGGVETEFAAEAVAEFSGDFGRRAEQARRRW